MRNSRYSCLIIEDDPAFVEILKMIVTKVQEVELLDSCDNTLDAAKRIDLGKPDVVLLDINISGLEGPEILELCDHKPKTIVISGHPKEVMENYDVEYVAYIQKPLKNSGQLVNAIHKCLELIDH